MFGVYPTISGKVGGWGTNVWTLRFYLPPKGGNREKSEGGCQGVVRGGVWLSLCQTPYLSLPHLLRKTEQSQKEKGEKRLIITVY